jgi:hypothetical protein
VPENFAMKRKIIAGCIIALFILLYFLPITITQNSSLTVHASYDKIMTGLNAATAWKKWWPDSAHTTAVNDTLLQCGSNRFSLQQHTPLSVIITQNGQQAFHAVTVAPNSNNTASTLSWKKVRYLRTAVQETLKSWFGDASYSAATLVQSLKTYIEDPVKYYGFAIQVEPVSDTFILTQKQVCHKSEVPTVLKRTFAALKQQLMQQQYKGKAEPMFFVDSTYADSTFVMAGISIDKDMAAPAPFRMMDMPKAHIVTGHFEGAYKNIGQLHKAMDRYMQDNKISPVAVPYEKVLTPLTTAQDSQHVKVKAFHPSLLP